MKITYFQNNKSEKVNWDKISRDERFFCFELFQSLKTDKEGLFSLIKEGNLSNHRQNGSKIPDNIESERFDIGVEVCFYRDLLKWYGKGIKGTGLPQKRTFDLALFSENAIIIIEAKAQQGFDTKQLMEFEEDRKRITRLFEIIERKAPEVFIVGLHSSNYKPKSSTISSFDSIIKWKDIARKYPDSKELFEHADNLYKK